MTQQINPGQVTQIHLEIAKQTTKEWALVMLNSAATKGEWNTKKKDQAMAALLKHTGEVGQSWKDLNDASEQDIKMAEALLLANVILTGLQVGVQQKAASDAQIAPAIANLDFKPKKKNTKQVDSVGRTVEDRGFCPE